MLFLCSESCQALLPFRMAPAACVFFCVCANPDRLVDVPLIGGDGGGSRVGGEMPVLVKVGHIHENSWCTVTSTLKE